MRNLSEISTYEVVGPRGECSYRVTLTLPPESLVEAFLDQPATAFAQTFFWPASDTVISDDAAPELHHVLVRNGYLEIQLTEEVDLVAATTEIQVDGAAIAWTLQANRYTLVSQDPLAPGGHNLAIGVGGLDLAGQGLEAAFSATVSPSAVSSTSFVFQQPDPNEVTASTAGNALGFHGLGADAATGLIYVRNRYFDPELGRFLTPDPMGFADGPNRYQAFLNSPINFSDPFGLEVEVSLGNYTFIVPEELEAYVKVQFGQLVGLAAEGRDRYRALREVDEPGLAMVKEYAQRAGIEMERALSIHRRLWMAWEQGGLRAVELEHAAIVDEMQLQLAQELLALPGVRVAHGLVQSTGAETYFDRGMLQGRATFQLLEDLALFYGCGRRRDLRLF